MWNQVLLGLCTIHVAVAFLGLDDKLPVPVPKNEQLTGNLYGGPLPLQNQKLAQNPTYLVGDKTQGLGQNKGLVMNTYGKLNQRKQAVLPQSSPLYQSDPLNTDNVYKTVGKPLNNQRKVNDKQYKPTEPPVYEYNSDLLYMAPDASKTLGGIQNQDDVNLYDKLPETQGPYDGITYTLDDTASVDDTADKVLVQKDQLEKLKAEIQSLEDENAVKYPAEDIPVEDPYPVEQPYPVEDVFEIPIDQSKYAPGQRLVCTVQ